MLSNHLILCCPLLLSQHQGHFQWDNSSQSGGQSIAASASASVRPKNIQGWFPLGLTGLISLQLKGLFRVFSSTTVQKHQFFSNQPSLWFNSLTSIHDHRKNHSFTIRSLVSKVMSLLFNRFLLAFLPRNKYLLFHGWSHHLEPKKIKSATVSTFSSSIYREMMGLNAMFLIF